MVEIIVLSSIAGIDKYIYLGVHCHYCKTVESLNPKLISKFHKYYRQEVFIVTMKKFQKNFIHLSQSENNFTHFFSASPLPGIINQCEIIRFL